MTDCESDPHEDYSLAERLLELSEWAGRLSRGLAYNSAMAKADDDDVGPALENRYYELHELDGALRAAIESQGEEQ